MGGGSGQPYIYEPGLQHKHQITFPYSDFNPRAYTQASYAALAEKAEREKAPKKTGPLISFNKHPDSWMAVANPGNTCDPMPASTKTKVKWVRIVQLLFRIIQELGALGLLTAAICIKGMPVTTAWVFRIAPGWDALITTYAIYHLSRNAKSRPPASSASYHMFALLMDLGVLPFFAYIALGAKVTFNLPVKSKLRWTSFFKTTQDTDILLTSVFIGSTALASLHLTSAFLDIWLIRIFRKISNLPPDMNPLEDNLTARPNRASKHKYKNSEASDMSTSTNNSSWKHLSGSTLSGDGFSHASVNNIKYSEIPDPRQLPFNHTRMDSDVTLTSDSPERQRKSKPDFENGGAFEQTRASRTSQRPHQPRSRGPPRLSSSPAKVATFAGPAFDMPGFSINQSNGRSRVDASTPPRRRPHDIRRSPERHSAHTMSNFAPSQAQIRSQQNASLLSDNWYVTEDDTQDLGTPSRHDRAKALEDAGSRGDIVTDQHPLRMNPPTPLNDQFPEAEDDVANTKTKRPALAERVDKGNGDKSERSETMHSHDTNTSSVYSESAPSLKSSTQKVKYYGNLAAATLGVRGKASNHSLLASNAALDATGLSADEYGFAASPPMKTRKLAEKPSPQDGSGRVVSRTGLDVVPEVVQKSGNGLKVFGLRERRDVSGKIAEEGRGGEFTGAKDQ